VGPEGSMGAGAPQPNPMIPANADAGIYSPNRFPTQQPRSVHISLFANLEAIVKWKLFIRDIFCSLLLLYNVVAITIISMFIILTK